MTPDCVESLATAILSIAADPTRAEHMGEAGREYVKEKFPVKGMVDAYIHQYTQLIEERRLADARKAADYSDYPYV